MNLSKPPAAYDPQDESNARRAIMQADQQNVKQGTVLNSFLMKDTATGTVRTVVITSGAFVIT